MLGIRRPPRRYVALAVLAGLPSLLVVTGHALLQDAAPLLTAEALRLVVRIALNQAWLEELLARAVVVALTFPMGLAFARLTVAARSIWPGLVSLASPPRGSSPFVGRAKLLSSPP